MTDGFIFDAEAGKLHHQPCGKSVRLEDEGPGAVDHHEATHVCAGQGWTGSAKLAYVSPGRTGRTGISPS